MFSGNDWQDPVTGKKYNRDLPRGGYREVKPDDSEGKLAKINPTQSEWTEEEFVQAERARPVIIPQAKVVHLDFKALHTYEMMTSWWARRIRWQRLQGWIYSYFWKKTRKKLDLMQIQIMREVEQEKTRKNPRRT